MKTIIMGVMLLFMSAAGWFILYKVAVAKYPNLLSINKSVEQITQPSPNPVVIPTKAPTKSPVVSTKAANKPNQIDCVGPDGVHFKTSQVECDNFNNAWNKPEPTSQPTTSYYRPYYYPAYNQPPTYSPLVIPTIAPYVAPTPDQAAIAACRDAVHQSFIPRYNGCNQLPPGSIVQQCLIGVQNSENVERAKCV